MKNKEAGKRFMRLRVLYGIIFINAFFLILSAAIILSSMWINSEKNAKELSAALIAEIQNSVSYRTTNYFYPAQTTNQSLGFLLYQYFEDPINNAADKEQLFNYYAEILKIHPQFKMVYYADTQGNLVMLNRMNDGTFSKRLVHNDGDLIRIRWEHTNISYYGAYPNTDESFETGYDPRKRIWYRAAETEKNMTWTPVYLFATDHLPGFTCAIPIFDPAGKTIGVNSIDIAVNELSRFLGTLRPTEGTKIVILDKENNLVALQARQEKDLEKLFVKSYDSHGNTTYNVSSIDAFNDEVLRSVLQRLIVKPGTLMRIKHGNEHYESILTPISVGDGLDLNIGIIIPENDIIGHVRRNLIYVTLFSIGVLILIMIFGSLLSHAIAEPMRRLAAEMMKIKSFDLDSKVYIHTNFMEIMDMRDSFENMRNGLRNFKRYVPSELVAELIGEEIDADLGGETRELTIFFSDIADFTTIAEQTDPERLVTDLCPYFEIISKSILETKGTIDKYIGDSVMAFWGAPVRRTDHAERACRSAIVIRNSLYTLFRQWENQGKLAFNTRMGIHTGEVIVGNMGYNERLNYTVIGDSVNISSRLEGMNKVYGTDIIVSEYTRNQCKDSFEFRRLDRVSVIGRRKGFEIYELIALKDDINKSLKKLFQYYEIGLQYYFDRKWDEGLKHFNAILKYRPNDTPSKLMRDRCLLYKQIPPPQDWGGVSVQPYK